MHGRRFYFSYGKHVINKGHARVPQSPHTAMSDRSETVSTALPSLPNEVAKLREENSTLLRENASCQSRIKALEQCVRELRKVIGHHHELEQRLRELMEDSTETVLRADEVLAANSIARLVTPEAGKLANHSRAANSASLTTAEGTAGPVHRTPTPGSNANVVTISLIGESPRASDHEVNRTGSTEKLLAIPSSVYRKSNQSTLSLSEVLSAQQPLVEVLKSFPLFAKLAGHVLDQLAALCVEQTKTAGQDIIKKGDKANEIYFLASGRVTIRNGERDIAFLKPISYFGELGLFNEFERTASINAKTDCSLVVLTREGLEDLSKRNKELGTALQTYIKEEQSWWSAPTMRRYKVELADFGAEFFRLIAHREVKKLPLFTDAEDAFIDKLASKAICETHPPNTAVFAINTPADSICFILSGDYIVVGETGLVHAQMEAGAFFGEVGVLLGMDRTASIVSGKKADNTLFKLTKEVLIEVAAQYPRFWSEIQAAAEERYALIKKRRGASTENQGGLVGVGAYGGANTMALGAAGTLAAPDTGLDELTKSAMGSFDELDLEISLQSLGRLSIFKGLGAGVLSRLALLMERQMWREGDTIIQCGDDAEAMFFLAAGDVNVISEFGDVVDECSGPGSFFGEVALLENVKRTATITCRSPTCSTYSLKNADLKKLLNEDPDFKKIIHESAKDRMQKFLMRNILA